MADYDPRVTPWQVSELDFPYTGSEIEQKRFLLRYAILAPSTRNTQPWKFAVDQRAIRIYADRAFWQPVADADQRELHISLGCALENLLIAAEHFGFAYHVEYLPSPLNADLVAEVTFHTPGEPSPFRPPELFDAIPRRHTVHTEYQPFPVPREAVKRIEDCCVNEGIMLHITDDMDIRRMVDELTSRADALEFANPAFREELGQTIGRGVFGTPWLLSVIGQLAMSYLNLGRATAKKDHEVLMSAPLLGILSATENSHTAQMKAGQVLERIYLTASTFGINIHPMSQTLQVAETKAEIAKLIPVPDMVPMQPFRIGYAVGGEHHTPRRALEEVLI